MPPKTKTKTKGATFAAKRSGTHALAIRPQALSLFWLFGCGVENENIGRSTVVTIDGPLEQKAGWWDGYDAIQARFKEALKEEATSSVVLRINSPGGDAAGCFEAVRMMREAGKRSGKRIVTYVDESAYSAAYALACVADEIYMPPSGGVGSVGVIATLMDRVEANEMWGLNVRVVYAGAHKADGHPDVPLSDDAIAGVQDDVNKLAAMFFDTVSASRGIKSKAVEALQAACLMGDEGLEAGLADGLMGFDELVAMLANDEATGARAPSTEKEAMPKGIKVHAKVSELEVSDVLAKPQVALPDASTLNASLALVGRDNAGDVQAATSKTDGTSSETTVTTESETDEDGNKTDTTTTTTTETETTGAEVSDDEEEEDDEEGEGEDAEDEGGGEEATARAASPAKRATSGDVLSLVRELTGLAAPAAQIGALRAMADNAKRARKAEKVNAKTAHVAKVDEAIRAGKLSPSKRAEAIAMSAGELAGYLKLAVPMVRKSPVAPAKDPKAATSSAPIPVDAAAANVARTMGLDPSKLAEHAAELRKSGVIH